MHIHEKNTISQSCRVHHVSCHDYLSGHSICSGNPSKVQFQSWIRTLDCGEASPLLCYLQGTANHVITYSPDYTTNETFMTFSDTNHSGFKDSGWSTGRYILKIGTGAMSWSSSYRG